jgi:ABC-type transport system involved in cytochrome c biogenesis permease subunit
MKPAPKPFTANTWPILMVIALLATLFLYWIDEGRYSLNGLLSIGNLIALSFYFLGLLAGPIFAPRTSRVRPSSDHLIV